MDSKVIADTYPLDLIVTMSDFNACGWESVVEACEEKSYSSLTDAFSFAATEVKQKGLVSQSKVLWLLANACSMQLSPQSLNQPFKPSIQIVNARSPIPDDFTPADLLFFSEIVDLIDDIWLKARLADLVWLCHRSLGIRFAEIAIDAYSEMPITPESWILDGQKCLGRGISLAKMLGQTERIERIETRSLTAFESATANDGFFAYWIAQLLADHRMCRNQCESIAIRLELLASQFEGAKNLDGAESYFDAASNWFQIHGDKTKAAKAKVSMAECWGKKAAVCTSSALLRNFAAEKAIQIYRTIPRAEREPLNVDNRIKELQQQMLLVGKKAVEEMVTIKTSTIDISECIHLAQKFVQGKPALEALAAFVGIYSGASKEKIHSEAKQILRESILGSFFGSTYFSEEGRVIAKQPSAELDSSGIREDQALQEQMIKSYLFEIQLAVKGYIRPAYEVLLQEHRLCLNDFVCLASNSPIVPLERAYLFGRALFAGYDGDFITSLHVLIPQIEHLVRVHLKGAGVITTTIDSAGIQNEKMKKG